MNNYNSFLALLQSTMISSKQDGQKFWQDQLGLVINELLQDPSELIGKDLSICRLFIDSDDAVFTDENVIPILKSIKISIS